MIIVVLCKCLVFKWSSKFLKKDQGHFHLEQLYYYAYSEKLKKWKKLRSFLQWKLTFYFKILERHLNNMMTMTTTTWWLWLPININRTSEYRNLTMYSVNRFRRTMFKISLRWCRAQSFKMQSKPDIFLNVMYCNTGFLLHDSIIGSAQIFIQFHLSFICNRLKLDFLCDQFFQNSFNARHKR